jgi:hypothetical protein
LQEKIPFKFSKKKLLDFEKARERPVPIHFIIENAFLRTFILFLTFKTLPFGSKFGLKIELERQKQHCAKNGENDLVP